MTRFPGQLVTSRPRTERTSQSRSIATVTLGNLMPIVASLVTAPLLAHALGASGRGLLAAAVAPLLLVTAALTLGVPESVTYFVAKRIAVRRSVVTGVVICCIAGPIGSVALVCASNPLSAGNEELRVLIAGVGLALTPSLLALAIRGYARACQAWRLVAIDQAFASVFRVAALASLLIAGTLTVVHAAVVLAVANFIGVVAYLPLALRRSRPQPTVPETAVTAREHRAAFIRFGLGTWVGSAAGIVLARLDQLLFVPLSDARELGIYAVAVSLADMVRTFNSAVRDVIFSTQAAEIDDAKLALATRVSTLITFAIAVFASVVGLAVIPFAFGHEFASTPYVLVVILVGTIIGNPGSVVAAGLSARGRPILRSLAISVGVLVNVLLLLMLLPSQGAMGAAVASAVANGVCGLTIIVFARVFFNLPPGHFIGLRMADVVHVKNMATTVCQNLTVRVRAKARKSSRRPL